MTRELSQMKVGERAYIVSWAPVRCEEGDTYLRLRTKISSEKGGTYALLVERYAGGFLIERSPRKSSLNSFTRSWIRDRLSEGIIKAACYFSPKEASMKVSEMEVGDRGYVVPWYVRQFSYGPGGVTMYIDKDTVVAQRKRGTSCLFIKRGPYGIKIDRLVYLERESPRKLDIQHMRIQGKPEIPRDVEWIIGWIGEDEHKSEREGRLERIERKVDRLLDGILSKRRS